MSHPVPMHDQLSSTLKLNSTQQEAQANDEPADTGPDLDSSSELAATVQELEAANEQLKIANEHLQATNEELEISNEELQTLNEELENMHEELEDRTHEIDRLNRHYVAAVEQTPWPIALVDSNQKILFCNCAALAFLGLKNTSLVGLHLSQVPVDIGLKKSLLKRHSTLVKRLKPIRLKRQLLNSSRSADHCDIHLTPVECEGVAPSVLITFSPSESRTKRRPTTKRKLKSLSARRSR
jgi:PAS domain S-box-containing protein